MIRGMAIAMVLIALSAPAWAARKDCAELKSEIQQRISSNGVVAFTLDVVEVATPEQGKVVGSCDGGSRKIVYLKTDLSAPKAETAITSSGESVH